MQKETLKERVYRGIYEAVTNGEYKSNDILTENQMIEKFGVSKSPVREALVELCKDGILTNIPRMGYQVRAVTLKEIIDILEFRVDVELGGLRKSSDPYRGKYSHAPADRRKALGRCRPGGI